MALYDEIVADSPVAYWPGTPLVVGVPLGWVDVTASPAHAIGAGHAPSYNQPPLAPAACQTASRFTAASSQRLGVTHDSKLNVRDTFTIEFWINWASNTAEQYVWNKNLNPWVRISTSGIVELGQVIYAPIASSNVALSGPTHVVITKSGSTTKIYFDGVDVTSAGTNRTFPSNTSNLSIGAISSTDGFLNATISDLALYPTALSAARAAAHYSASLPTYVAAALNAKGTVTAAGIRRALAKTNPITGAASISAKVVRRQYIASNLAGAGTLNATVIRRQYIASTLLAAGTLAADAHALRAAIANLTATGTLNVDAHGRFAIAANLTGTLTMVAGRDLVGFPEQPEWVMPTLVTVETVSDELIHALSGSHQIALLIQILDPITGEPALTLDTVQAGTVTLDSNAAIRGRLDLEIMDDGTRNLIPAVPWDTLTPYGTEIRVARGIRYPDGTAETVALGVFRIRQVETEDTGDSLTVRIAGVDRWSRIEDARIEATTIIPGNTNVNDAIEMLVRPAHPEVELDLPPTTDKTPQIVLERGDDRGTPIRELAVSVGREIYYDGAGTLVARPVAEATDPERWHLSEGAGGLLIQASREWDAERVYNKVIASGEPIDDTPPVCAQVWDDNPESPTYFYGPFGQRPRFYVSGMLTTEQQAVGAAAGILAKAIGTSQRISFGSIVNPALQPGTVARITRGRLKLDEKHVIDTVTIPLTATEPMTGTTRVVEVEGE